MVGRALLQLEQAELTLKARADVLGGTDTFFKTRVTALTRSTATLLTCDNSTRDVVQSRATGKADAQFAASASQDYIFEDFGLVRHSGHWAITSLADATLPQASARQCQP